MYQLNVYGIINVGFNNRNKYESSSIKLESFLRQNLKAETQLSVEKSLYIFHSLEFSMALVGHRKICNC